MTKQLARITKASLEIQERGILNFWIHVAYEEGGSQGIGGITLDQYDKDLQKRIGTAYGCEMIRQVLLVLEVDDFSEMKDKDIFVLGTGPGLSFQPKGIQVLSADGGLKVIFSDIAEQMIKNH